MKMFMEKLVAISATVVAMNAAVAAPNVYIPLGAVSQVQVVDAASQRVIGTVEGVGNAHGSSAEAVTAQTRSAS